MTDRPPAKLDLLAVLTATDSANAYADHCRKVSDDDEKATRLSAQLCRRCHYGGNVGAGVGRRPCAICGTPVTGYATGLPVACAPCAARRRLCARCGGDVDGKTRRKIEDIA